MDYNNFRLADMYGPVNTPGQPGDQLDLASQLARMFGDRYMLTPQTMNDPGMLRQQLAPMMGVPNPGAWNGGDLYSAANNPTLRQHMISNPQFFQRK